MKFLNIFMLIVRGLPALIEAIKTLEGLIPGQGKGEQKLAMLRSLLESAHEVAEDTEEPFAAVWPSWERLIARLVALFNKTGEFDE